MLVNYSHFSLVNNFLSSCFYFLCCPFLGSKGACSLRKFLTPGLVCAWSLSKLIVFLSVHFLLRAAVELKDAHKCVAFWIPNYILVL